MSKWYNLGMRKTNLVVGEYYHIYNRGTDKRNIFTDNKDLARFWENLFDFNQKDPIGSVYEFSFKKKSGKLDKKRKPLVQFIAYCINPNHFHFLLTPLQEKGIEKFMQRLGNGYTKYFNNKYKRNGVLFQGKFKSKHVNSNEYLIHLSVYINGNDQLGHRMSKLSKSSLGEFLGLESGQKLCNTDIVLGQFRNVKEYKDVFNESLKNIELRKEMLKELEM
jgi:REP element-mobilizing transposase RayT